MAAIASAPARLPQRPKLRSSLKSSTDPKVLQRYLDIVAQQPKGRDNGLRILLQTSAEVGNGLFAEALLAAGAHIDDSSDTTLPPLYYAVEGGHVGTVSLLLSRGAQTTGTDKGQRSLVMYAALSGNVEVMEMLLNHGASMAGIDRQGRSAVIHAVSAGHAEVLKLLLRRGADIKIADESKKTPMMYAASKGNIEVLRVLLNSGAEIRGVDNEKRTALMHAMSGGHVHCVKLLLNKGADIGASCLKSAALAGQNEILGLLIQNKANVNVIDDDERSPLLNLGADPAKSPKWARETVDILIAAHAKLEVVDKLRRNVLHWASVNGHVSLVQATLSSCGSEQLSRIINATERRGKTALHLACQHNRPETVKLLLERGANIAATSEGLWTPFLIAAKAGHVEVVDLLLKSSPPASVNARTSSGMTALHWAAENGRVEVVKRILQEESAWKNPKDSFHTTPLVRAGQRGHMQIIDLLKPHIFGGSLNKHARDACNSFTASIVDFWLKQGRLERNVVSRISVYTALYASEPNDKSKFAVTTKLENIRAPPNFRWIHLPANNLDWAEALITKIFVEGGGIDITSFKAMLRLLGQQQHRGAKVHSRFMRPTCQHVTGEAFRSADSSVTQNSGAGSKSGRPPAPVLQPSTPTPPATITSPSPSAFGSGQSGTMKRKNARHQNGAAVLFLPYLHWETDHNRNKMRDVVNKIQDKVAFAPKSRDENLIQGYFDQLHFRRTLDQYKHHSINTDKLDSDQVIYRYCVNNSNKFVEPKVFYVDQLWLFVFPDIVLTCFPERWGQPTRDPLSLFDGLIEEVNSKTQPPVKSVEELAALITGRCTGSFDRHEWGYDDAFLFLEMFELSIGTMTRREKKLFERFQQDSSEAFKGLGKRNRTRYRRDFLKTASVSDPKDRENDEDEWLREDTEESPDDRPGEPDPEVVNRLLNISKEAELLVECKDIEDELSILSSVLQQQNLVLQDMGHVFKAFTGAHSTEVPRKCAQQKRLVDLHLLDIERMSNQTKSVNVGLVQVLDLKQKHANALEARFARDQAQSTARQGQTIMIFTIVTIIFLPMSFMAAVFAINIVEFPHDPSNGGNGLPLGYVAKYMFGIGLGVSLPLIAIAFVFGDIQSWIWTVKNRIGKHSGGLSTADSGAEAKKLVGSPESFQPSREDLNNIYRRPTRTWTGATGASAGTDLEAGPGLRSPNRHSTSVR